MTNQQETLHQFLVDVFNDILRLEEVSLRAVRGDLSVSELHVLESVQLCAGEEGAGMADVAARLRVTSGTLTVAVKTLEQKGYLTRARHSHDKRRVVVSLTPRAAPVLQAHDDFHSTLVQQVTRQLCPAQLDAFSDALRELHAFFRGLQSY